jgi:hypothetical protein
LQKPGREKDRLEPRALKYIISSMKSVAYPLQVPTDLMEEVSSAAKRLNLSKADVLRQSIKLGLPRLKEQLSARMGRVTNVDPLSAAVLERLYREREDDDQSIRRFIKAQP